MSEFTHIVSFAEITRHEVHLTADSDDEAIAIAERYTETLSPTAKTHAFVTGDTTFEYFEARPILKRFNVIAEARVIYETGIDARDEADAEEKAEDLWLRDGVSGFNFVDYLDLRFEAEESEP